MSEPTCHCDHLAAAHEVDDEERRACKLCPCTEYEHREATTTPTGIERLREWRVNGGYFDTASAADALAEHDALRAEVEALRGREVVTADEVVQAAEREIIKLRKEWREAKPPYEAISALDEALGRVNALRGRLRLAPVQAQVRYTEQVSIDGETWGYLDETLHRDPAGWPFSRTVPDTRTAAPPPATPPLPGKLCLKHLGDNDGTSPQLTCIRPRGHDGLCDNVRGDDQPAAPATPSVEPPRGETFVEFAHHAGPLPVSMFAVPKHPGRATPSVEQGASVATQCERCAAPCTTDDPEDDAYCAKCTREINLEYERDMMEWRTENAEAQRDAALSRLADTPENVERLARVLRLCIAHDVECSVHAYPLDTPGPKL